MREPTPLAQIIHRSHSQQSTEVHKAITCHDLRLSSVAEQRKQTVLVRTAGRKDEAGLWLGGDERVVRAKGVSVGLQLVAQADEFPLGVELECLHIEPGAFPLAGLPGRRKKVRERNETVPQVPDSFHVTVHGSKPHHFKAFSVTHGCQ